MRNRRSNGNSSYGEFGLRTPAETQRYSRETFASECVWPLVQSAVIALSTVAAITSVALAPVMMGERAFWFACGIAGIANIIYAISYESRWQEMLAWPVLTGIIAWCFYAFLDEIFELPESPWLVLASLISVVFSITTCLWLWLSVGQKLIQQSLHQQVYGWQAIANVFEWFVKKPQARPERPMFVNQRAADDIQIEQYVPPPAAELTDLELFLLLVRQENTLSRDKLIQCTLDNGQKLTKSAWARGISDLVEAGYIINGGQGYRWATGASAEVALKQFRRPTPPGSEGSEW